MEEIRFGCVGVGGKGSSDSAAANNQQAHGSKVVAVCDIDDGTLEGVKKKFPGAKGYNDFRKMLDEMGKSIDAVTVRYARSQSCPCCHDGNGYGETLFLPKTSFAFDLRGASDGRNGP